MNHYLETIFVSMSLGALSVKKFKDMKVVIFKKARIFFWEVLEMKFLYTQFL